MTGHEWFCTKEYSFSEVPFPAAKAGKKGFVDRTLGGIFSFFRDAIISSAYAEKKGFLQSIDARVKVAITAAFLVLVTLIHQIYLLAALYFVVFILAITSMISAAVFISRVWLFIPLFTGIVVLPAIFNVIVPGEPLLVLGKIGSTVVAITRQGVNSALFILLRVAVSVSTVVLLLLTTRWHSILKALRIFKVPRTFVFITGMTYRYIHLLLRLVEEMQFAVKSRMIAKPRIRGAQKNVASQMGNLIKKSMDMSEKVYTSMISRGYTGEIKTLDTFSLSFTDYLFITSAIILMAACVYLNYF
ncbi:MAG: cobalt ECF transporter T component CbiQ [Firmicutes bacterium]|nr:cobalt ECF transporter T component CbiQ [Bacillota bacterium]